MTKKRRLFSFAACLLNFHSMHISMRSYCNEGLLKLVLFPNAKKKALIRMNKEVYFEEYFHLKSRKLNLFM